MAGVLQNLITRSSERTHSFVRGRPDDIGILAYLSVY